jgi:hypothetical protein
MFWLFWQLCGVALAIGGVMLGLMILWPIVMAPFYLVAWLFFKALNILDRRRASIARAEAAHEERLRAATP